MFWVIFWNVASPYAKFQDCIAEISNKHVMANMFTNVSAIQLTLHYLDSNCLSLKKGGL